MASTWGSTALRIKVDTLVPGVRPGPLTEIALLPDPAALSTISTVVQQQGKSRKTINCTLRLTTMTEYDSYIIDMDAGTTRTLTIDDTNIAATYIIQNVSPVYVQNNLTWCDITWLEV
jgi:hypothetical protein